MEIYPILGLNKLKHYVHEEISKKSLVNVSLPKVYNLSNGGEIRFHFDEINIYKFSPAVIEPLSDTIVIREGVVWTKATYVTANKELPDDLNVAAYDFTNQLVQLRRRGKQLSVKKAYSLFARKSVSWSHCLFEILPKLIFLKNTHGIGEASLLVPSQIDAHIMQMILDITRDMPSIEVIMVDEDTEVVCEELYWCSPTSYICGHAAYVHPSDIVIPEVTRRDILKFLSGYGKKEEQGQKLFIGRERGGSRNISNYDEIEILFAAAGYRIIYPHLLTLDEKATLFSNATHIVGPASSGIMNALFSKKPCKVLSIINFERCFDTLLTQIAHDSPTISLWLMVGRLIGEQGINSSYSVNLDDVIGFLGDTEFDGEALECFRAHRDLVSRKQ